ncbi:DUF433 domain-containing protein [Muricoccus vinaceus]|uniref:DUF433 domain-containing protein n=1 Tax=Muricoccus vinaceus TaxID=424704 RepID=A0ABV6IT98_9PROT
MQHQQKGHVRVGDLRRVKVTLPQAASILHVDVGQIRKAIDRQEITATYAFVGNRKIRVLDGVDLLYLRLGRSLKVGIRRPLYKRLKGAPEQETLDKPFTIVPAEAGRGLVDNAVVQVSGEAAETLRGISAAQEAAGLIDDAGNIAGTRVEAHRVAALISGGMSADEVLEDYPNLGRLQIDAAVGYAAANPKQGRPYPGRTVKSVLRGGSGGLAAAFALSRDGEEGFGEGAG